jgi:hypothetical protein
MPDAPPRLTSPHLQPEEERADGADRHRVLAPDGRHRQRRVVPRAQVGAVLQIGAPEAGRPAEG